MLKSVWCHGDHVTQASSPVQAHGPIRVLIVDDSSVVRGLIHKWLQSEAGIEVAGLAMNGLDGVRKAQAVKPHVIILDVEMPGMDGVTAIPALLAASPGARIVMSSTLTSRNAEITLKALQAGATDYLAKPQASGLVGASEFRRQLIEKVRTLGEIAQRGSARSQASAAPTVNEASTPAPLQDAGEKEPQRRSGNSAKASLTPASIDVLAIGSSTGGPQALRTLMEYLGRERIGVPVLITQHMPAMFTTILAEQLAKASGLNVCEGVDGEMLRPGCVYVAPGDHHMTVQRRQDRVVIRLNQDAPENFCRPSVDPLFRSVAQAFRDRALYVVLTGMGQDGLKGAREGAACGGQFIAQDEATSVVWGMPGAIANAGIANAIKPLEDIGPAIMWVVSGAHG